MRRLFPVVALQFVMVTALVPVGAGHAQSGEQPIVAAYVEGFGNTGIASVNMDLIFRDHFLFRFGGLPLFRDDTGSRDGETWQDRMDGVLLVVMGGFAAGNGPVRFETGLGFTFGMRENRDGLSEDVAAFTATIGLRHQPPDQPIMFRIGFTPRFSADGIRPGLGFSLGVTLDDKTGGRGVRTTPPVPVGNVW